LQVAIDRPTEEPAFSEQLQIMERRLAKDAKRAAATATARQAAVETGEKPAKKAKSKHASAATASAATAARETCGHNGCTSTDVKACGSGAADAACVKLVCATHRKQQDTSGAECCLACHKIVPRSQAKEADSDTTESQTQREEGPKCVNSKCSGALRMLTPCHGCRNWVCEHHQFPDDKMVYCAKCFDAKKCGFFFENGADEFSGINDNGMADILAFIAVLPFPP